MIRCTCAFQLLKDVQIGYKLATMRFAPAYGQLDPLEIDCALFSHRQHDGVAWVDAGDFYKKLRLKLGLLLLF